MSRTIYFSIGMSIGIPLHNLPLWGMMLVIVGYTVLWTLLDIYRPLSDSLPR